MAFRPVDTKVSFPQLEETVLAWWKANGVIEESLAGGDPARSFVFFEGPPSANGLPGVHHVESRVSKDIINRFHRLLGERVVGARGGWDTHGLPVELQAEKKLGFKNKADVERYGVEAFNKVCRELVFEYIGDWERLTDRIGFWLDLKEPYATFQNKYIESGWWIFRQLWERNLLFRNYKVTMHCPRCGTSLADHEVAQGFKDNVDDPSVWVRFKAISAQASLGADDHGVPATPYHPHAAELAHATFLAWTTTPWTLPSNAGLAVNAAAYYVLAEHNGERVVLAEALAPQVLGEGYRVLGRWTGAQLVGLRYEPLFKGVGGPGEAVDLHTAWRVVADDFVSLEDGTGIVHISPAYGDLEVGRTYGLPTLFSVGLDGTILHDFGEYPFVGMFFKQADPVITQNLEERGLLFRKARVRHSYPFCWRCDTPLLYFAKQSWYIRTTELKDRLVALNKTINWVPPHIQEGRFGNWLANNIDWAVSRERYWGTPLPIWVSADGHHTECIGSVAELESKVGRSLADLDLHRPYVDELTWEAPDGHGLMLRIPDVADAWFDSGAMPVAQWHYPFENQEMFALAGQADFISEAIDQTRGWFYTLHALSTLLFDRTAFKNVICLGHILDSKGEKMSKSKGNVVDPWYLLTNYGADATRWYMYASAPPYNPRRFSPESVGEMLRQFVLTLWNTYSFFVTYANLDGWQPAQHTGTKNLTALDRWALASLNQLVRDVGSDLAAYDIHQPAKRIEGFVEGLSNWFVRRSRRRFWKGESDADKHAAYSTLYTCLTTLAQLLAPFMPFIAEEMYRNLVAEQDNDAPRSVHLAQWPIADAALIDDDLLAATELLLHAVTAGRAARKGASLKVRQPLQTLLVRAGTTADNERLRQLEDDLRDELNVKEVRYLEGSAGLVEYRFKPNLKAVGKKYGKLVPALREALLKLTGAAAVNAGAAVEGGQSFDLVVGDQTLTLTPDEVLLETSAPEGYAVAEDGGVLVALDTTLTPALEREGAARELVRVVNDARKAAGFDLMDRITLHIGPASPLLDVLLSEHNATIASDVLATRISVGDAPADAYHTEADLGLATVTVAVQKHG